MRCAFLILFFGLMAVFLSVGGERFSVNVGTSAHAQSKGKPLSVTRYFKLRPFTLPVLYKGEIEEHFTIVMALELTNEDARDEVRRRAPRIRNEFYKALLSLVTFRRKGAPIPDIEVFKAKLMRVAIETCGRDRVKNLLIQQAFKRAVR